MPVQWRRNYPFLRLTFPPASPHNTVLLLDGRFTSSLAKGKEGGGVTGEEGGEAGVGRPRRHRREPILI